MHCAVASEIDRSLECFAAFGIRIDGQPHLLNLSHCALLWQVLHYYLVDDTFEIREVHEANDGRDPFPVMLKRQKVPRNFRDVHRTCSFVLY